MPQLNFSKQFAAAVSDGSKRQTIRAKRKNPIRTGDTLHLFTGLRTKQARRLLPTQVCREAQIIRIRWKPIKQYKSLEITLEKKGKLNASDAWAFMKADGFFSREEFAEWFLPKGTDEFNGQLITW